MAAIYLFTVLCKPLRTARINGTVCTGKCVLCVAGDEFLTTEGTEFFHRGKEFAACGGGVKEWAGGQI